MTRLVNLETHILDIVNLFRWEELSEVVLCGHSYGGMVITGAADRVSDRVRSLVYLDAFLPENGQSLLDTTIPDRRSMLIDRASHDPYGRLMTHALGDWPHREPRRSRAGGFSQAGRRELAQAHAFLARSGRHGPAGLPAGASAAAIK